MKNLNYAWINTLEDYKNVVNNNCNFTMMIPQPSDCRGKYIVCADNYKEVFKYLNDKSFDNDSDIAFPIGLGEENFYEN